jgi:hypothetical protein
MVFSKLEGFLPGFVVDAIVPTILFLEYPHDLPNLIFEIGDESSSRLTTDTGRYAARRDAASHSVRTYEL